MTAAFWGWFAGSNVALGLRRHRALSNRTRPGRRRTVSIPTPSCFGADLCGAVHDPPVLRSGRSYRWTDWRLALRYTAACGPEGMISPPDASTRSRGRCASETGARTITGAPFRELPRYRGLRHPALVHDGPELRRVGGSNPNADGGRENPFYNENARLILTMTFRADGLYAATRDKRAAAGRF